MWSSPHLELTGESHRLITMNDKDIKTAVLEALKDADDRTLSTKKLRKIVTGNADELKAKFASILDEMALGKKITIDGENVTKVSKRGREEAPSGAGREGRERNDVGPYESGGGAKSRKAEKYEVKVIPVEPVSFDIEKLWANGEQVPRNDF